MERRKSGEEERERLQLLQRDVQRQEEELAEQLAEVKNKSERQRGQSELLLQKMAGQRAALGLAGGTPAAAEGERLAGNTAERRDCPGTQLERAIFPDSRRRSAAGYRWRPAGRSSWPGHRGGDGQSFRREELSQQIPEAEGDLRRKEEALGACASGLAALESQKKELERQLLAAKADLRFGEIGRRGRSFRGCAR